MTHLKLFSPLIFLLFSLYPVYCRSKYRHIQNGLQLQGYYVEQKIKSSYLRTRNVEEVGDGEDMISKEKENESISEEENIREVMKKIKKKTDGYRKKTKETISKKPNKGEGDSKKTKKEGKKRHKKIAEESNEEKDDSKRDKEDRKKAEKKNEEGEEELPKASDLVKEIEAPKETYEEAKGGGKEKSDGETTDSPSENYSYEEESDALSTTSPSEAEKDKKDSTSTATEDSSSASPPSMPSTPVAFPPTISIPNEEMFASCSDSNIAFSAASSAETSTMIQSNSSAMASTNETASAIEKTGTVRYHYQIESRTDTPSDDTMTRIKQDIFDSLADNVCDGERRLSESIQHIHRHLEVVQISSPPLDYRSNKDCLLEHRSFDGVCNMYKGKIDFVINDEGRLTRIRDTKAHVKLFLVYYANTTNFTAIDSNLVGMRILEDEDEDEEEEKKTDDNNENDENDEEVTTSTAMLSVTEEEVTLSGPSDIAIVGIASAGLLALGILYFSGYAIYKKRTPSPSS